MITPSAVECPHRGCGHYGIPVRGRPRHRAHKIWLCESCSGQLPISNPATSPRGLRGHYDYEEWTS